jgi:hypothetical protein
MDTRCLPAQPPDADDSNVKLPTLPDADVTPELCPNCEAKLIDPAGLGWCRKCGYCKSLEEDIARVPLHDTRTEHRPPSFLGLVEFFQLLKRLPSWAWVLIGGALTLVCMNIPPSQSLPMEGIKRAAWSSTEIILGLVMIFSAQLWALFILGPHDDKLGFKDAILPGRLWVAAVQKLPATHGQVWLASWGITMILSGILLVGGLSHWLSYLPKSLPPDVPVQTTE